MKGSYFKYVFLLDEIIFPPVLHARFPTDFWLHYFCKDNRIEYFRLEIILPLFSNSFPLQKRLGLVVVLASSHASCNFSWKHNHRKAPTSAKKLSLLIC